MYFVAAPLHSNFYFYMGTTTRSFIIECVLSFPFSYFHCHTQVAPLHGLVRACTLNAESTGCSCWSWNFEELPELPIYSSIMHQSSVWLNCILHPCVPQLSHCFTCMSYGTTLRLFCIPSNFIYYVSYSLPCRDRLEIGLVAPHDIALMVGMYKRNFAYKFPWSKKVTWRMSECTIQYRIFRGRQMCWTLESYVWANMLWVR